ETQMSGDPLEHPLAGAGFLQPDPPGAIHKVAGTALRELECCPALADTTGANERKQACRRLAEHLAPRCQLRLTPNERCGRGGEMMQLPVERPRWRNVLRWVDGRCQALWLCLGQEGRSAREKIRARS